MARAGKLRKAKPTHTKVGKAAQSFAALSPDRLAAARQAGDLVGSSVQMMVSEHRVELPAVAYVQRRPRSPI